MNTAEYWANREKNHMKAEHMSDEEVKKRMKTIVTNHMSHVKQELQSFYQRYADTEGLPYAEAKKLIGSTDIEDYKELAEYYVKNRHDKDIVFSDKANKEMRLYNVTMKVNREQLILARMAEHLKNMGAEVEHEMKDYLNDATVREFKRQAGLIGDINLSTSNLEALINSTHLTDKKIWSERLWENVADVQKEVDKTIKDVLLRGRHADDGVKRLRELTGRSEFEARRLLLTETTRVQSEAQLLSMTQKKIGGFVFIAQLDDRTTVRCRSMHKTVHKLSEAKIGVNVPPLHQFCRSTTAPNIDADDVVEKGGGVFNLFNEDDAEEVEIDGEDISGSDDAEVLLDDFEGILDQLEQKWGKEYKQEKVKKVEAVIKKERSLEKLVPKHSKTLVDKLPPEKLEQINIEFFTGDERALKAYNKYTDNVKYENRRNQAHHMAHTQTVYLDEKMLVKGSSKRNPQADDEFGRVFFHEYAHAIDNQFARKNNLGITEGYSNFFKDSKTNRTLGEIATDEWNAYEKTLQKQLKEKRGVKVSIGDTRRHIRTEIMKKPVHLYADLSDMVDGVTKSKLHFDWGHGKKYWMSGTKLPKEIFAELFSMLVTSYEAYQFTKQYLPETVEAFEEMLNIMVGEEDEQTTST